MFHLTRCTRTLLFVGLLFLASSGAKANDCSNGRDPASCLCPSALITEVGLVVATHDTAGSPVLTVQEVFLRDGREPTFAVGDVLSDPLNEFWAGSSSGPGYIANLEMHGGSEGSVTNYLVRGNFGPNGTLWSFANFNDGFCQTVVDFHELIEIWLSSQDCSESVREAFDLPSPTRCDHGCSGALSTSFLALAALMILRLVLGRRAHRVSAATAGADRHRRPQGGRSARVEVRR